MLVQAQWMLKHNKYVVQVWDAEGGEEKFVRGVVDLKNKTQFERLVNDTLKPEKPFFIDYIYISPSHMSYSLPGIQQLHKHPETGKEMTLHSIIMDLNDHHGWSREKIADWIETFDDIPKFELNAPKPKVVEIDEEW